MVIYYFSGTGNSLFIARKLAGKFNARLISIAEAIKVDVAVIDDECAGFVFPTYFASNMDGLPLIVKRFVKKLIDIDGKYLFAINTSEHTPGTTLGAFKRLIKKQGGKLAAGFVLNMSQKSLKEDLFQKGNKIVGTTLKDAESKITYQDRINAKLSLIENVVSNRDAYKIETRSIALRILMFPLRMLLIKPVFLARYLKLSKRFSLSFNKILPYCDSSFMTNEKCIGCSVCADVCPVGNIDMIDEHPHWNHHCENCLACYVWCPQNAITGEIVHYNENKHHPEVKLYDMIK